MFRRLPNKNSARLRRFARTAKIVTSSLQNGPIREELERSLSYR